MTRRALIGRLLLAALLALGLARVAAAYTYPLDQVTVDNTAGGVALTATKYAPAGLPAATKGWCRVRTAEISITFDRSTTVTATVGTLMEVADIINLPTPEYIQNLRAIRTTGSSGQLDCHYFR